MGGMKEDLLREIYPRIKTEILRFAQNDRLRMTWNSKIKVSEEKGLRS